MFLNHNGSILPINTPIFGADNRAFRYGDALFETIRMRNGRIPFLDYHWARLQAGMSLLGINIPVDWSEAFWQEQIDDLGRRNKVFKEARIRLSIYRADGGRYTPLQDDPFFLLELEAMPEDSFVLNEKGLSISLFTDVPKHTGPLSALKSANSIPYVLAGKAAKKQGTDDCLILNEHVRLVEAIASNLFIVKDNKILTPSLNEGCIAGVMRQVIKNQVMVLETPLLPEILLEADEIFLSNALRGVQWVGSYGKKRYFNKVGREVMERIAAL